MKSMIQAAVLTAVLLFVSGAQANEWVCDLGLDDSVIYVMTFPGDASGKVLGPVKISVAGLPAMSSLSATNEEPGAGELSKIHVGAEDPRSNSILRITNELLGPNSYKSFYILLSSQIKKEFEGPCRFN